MTATAILFDRGFRPTKIAKLPEGDVFTSWIGPDGELKVSLRTAAGTTRVFSEEFAMDGELTIHKQRSAFDDLAFAKAGDHEVVCVNEDVA